MSRLHECLTAMTRHDVDVMLLGREANARTVSDAPRLWLAGTRAFSPGCVVVRRTGAVHLLSNTDSGFPPGFPTDHLYGVTWNPDKLVAALDAIDGVRDARRVGVDGMSPMAKALLARVTPAAETVDAAAVFAELWAVPDPEKRAGVERAGTVARAGLDAMAAMLRPGSRPRDLRGACAATFAAMGVTTPAFEAVVAPAEPGSSSWLAPERALEDGERVVLRSGALRNGWESSIARTYRVGSPSIEMPSPDGWDHIASRCRAGGVSVGSIRALGAAVNGSGRGVEPWPDDLVLVAGLTVALEVRDAAAIRQDTFAIENG